MDDRSRGLKLMDDLSRNISQGDNPGLHGLKHLVVTLGVIACVSRVLVPGGLGINVHAPVDLVHVHALIDALGVPLGEGNQGFPWGIQTGSPLVLENVLPDRGLDSGGPLHVGLVLLQDVLVGGRLPKAAVALANTDVFFLCGAGPVDVEV